jgi:hypothetical protein
MKVIYDSWKGEFHVYMDTDRQRLHKGAIEIRISALKLKGTGIRFISCEYDSPDAYRVLTHVAFTPTAESYDTLKELCVIDESAKGRWREMDGT